MYSSPNCACVNPINCCPNQNHLKAPVLSSWVTLVTQVWVKYWLQQLLKTFYSPLACHPPNLKLPSRVNISQIGLHQIWRLFNSSSDSKVLENWILTRLGDSDFIKENYKSQNLHNLRDQTVQTTNLNKIISSVAFTDLTETNTSTLAVSTNMS